MNGSVERCIKKANSKLERKRRRISQIPLFEKPVDAAKGRTQHKNGTLAEKEAEKERKN